ncbi:MAG TPA: PilZ domain-containing protein [Candidatus Omnitrophota bacterium]|nr:PilZ domain-containing protein [Candidatus Omnitrophota bacterium]
MQEPTSFQEKRKFPRYEMDMPIDIPGMAGLRLKNISANGVGVLTREQLSLGRQVHMQLQMPDNQEHVPLQGQVVWINRMGENQFRAGIQMPRGLCNPIPLVLRNILYQAQSRQRADRWAAFQASRKNLP